MFITKTKKSPYYQLVYEVNGKRKIKSTKSRMKKDALDFLKKFNPNLILSNESNKKIKLSNFRNEYLEHCIGSKSNYYIESIQLSFKQLNTAVGDIDIDNINGVTIEKFLVNKFKDSPHAANLYYRTLKATFTKAVQWKFIQSNPLKGFSIPKPINKYPIFISKNEFESIINCTTEHYLKNLFIMAFYTGMRLG